MSRIGILVFGGLVLIGAVCRGEEAKRAPVPSLIGKTASNVVVRIDGKDIYAEDIGRAAKAELILRMNKLRKNSVGSREMAIFGSRCLHGTGMIIGAAVVSRYFRDNQLTISSNQLAAVTKSFERQFGVRSKKLKRWHNVNDLKFMLGKNAFRVDEMIGESARYEVVTNHIISKAGIDISDEMVTNRLERIAKYNANMVLTNALIFAQATNVWKRIVAKEITFEEAAKSFSEDENLPYGCGWGSFTTEQLRDEPQVLALLPSIKDGDITPPVESDGGLAILRKDPDDNEKTYTFSRVFFRLPMYFEKESAAEARALLRDQQEKAAIREALDRTAALIKIEYHSGTNTLKNVSIQDFNAL